MGIAGQAHGKLLLFGEHAAVYGHPAVGLALPELTSARFEGPVRGTWVLDGLPPHDRPTVLAVLSRLESVLGSAGRGRREVRIDSSVPRGVGFGSSAALCGALARGMLGLAGETVQTGETVGRAWELAHEAERLFHGTPSGVDTGLSLIGGTCVLWPHPPAVPSFRRIPARGIHLVFAAVPRDAGCAALVGGLAARVRSGDEGAAAAIRELGSLSKAAAELLLDEPADMHGRLGSLAEAAMRILALLGLSTPDLEVVLEAARGAGALGAKLSGAGAGGAFYAVAPDPKTASRIARGIEEAAAAAGITLLLPPRRLIA